MLTAENVILTLKVAVIAVTVLLIASLIALSRGRYHLHGRINMVFFALTVTALFGLEVVVRLIDPKMFEEFFDRTDAWTKLYIHLAFSMPATLLLVGMLYTGLKRRRTLHYRMGLVFLVFWIGTFITGVFFLPHQGPPQGPP